MVASVGTETDAGVDLFDVIDFFRRQWLLIVGCVLAFAAIAAAIGLTMTPMYRAEVVISEARDANMGGSSSLMSQLGGIASLAGVNVGGGLNREAQAVLGSRRLAEEFILRDKLLPELFKSSKERQSLWLGVQKLRQGILDIRDDQRRGVTTISIRWHDPATAAKWANRFVALANELMRNRAIEDSNRNIAYLRVQAEKTDVVGIQRVMYNLIESETKTLMLANGRVEYAFTVVDPAVTPEIRVSPKRTIMVVGGGLLGAVIGILAGVLRDMIRRRRSA